MIYNVHIWYTCSQLSIPNDMVETSKVKITELLRTHTQNAPQLMNRWSYHIRTCIHQVSHTANWYNWKNHRWRSRGNHVLYVAKESE